MFRLWDIRRNGKIDRAELFFAIILMSENVADEHKLRFIFKAYDLDGDGEINQNI